MARRKNEKVEEMTKTNEIGIKVHPAADIFPMLDSDQLASLAESIATNGQRFPIMLWKNGEGEFLIDGRNRRKACELAGIEPKSEYFAGDEEDMVAYIADVNLERRDLTKQQKIMALATLYPEPEEKGGAKKKGQSDNPELLKKLHMLAKSLSSARTRLAQARKLLFYPDLSQAVLNGSNSLEKALKIAHERDLEAKSDADKIAELREKAPELAAQVPDTMTLSVAWAAYQQKLADHAEMVKGVCDSWFRGIVDTSRNLWGYGTGVETKEDFRLYVIENEEFLERIDALGGLMWEHVDADAFRAGTEYLIQILSAIKEKKYGKEKPA
jgi:hypothetical protein